MKVDHRLQRKFSKTIQLQVSHEHDGKQSTFEPEISFQWERYLDFYGSSPFQPLLSGLGGTKRLTLSAGRRRT